MADVRIHDLPSAASWNGFFPQDKPGGPTECVSVATVEARLELDGFVKTAALVAGYQPIENQRLRTTDSPAFNRLVLTENGDGVSGANICALVLDSSEPVFAFKKDAGPSQNKYWNIGVNAGDWGPSFYHINDAKTLKTPVWQTRFNTTTGRIEFTLGLSGYTDTIVSGAFKIGSLAGTLIGTAGVVSALSGTDLVLANGTTIPQSTFATGSPYQPLDSDLTAIAALATTPFGRSLLTQADAAAARTAIGALAASLKGTALGVAELGADGRVPPGQLPSYVDDVVEVANFAALPGTGETGKIYITLDTNLTYRWSGSTYTSMSSSLALGETSATAYRGDRGKTAYDHSEAEGNPHGLTRADIGAHPQENQLLSTGSAVQFNRVALTGDGHQLAIAPLSLESDQPVIAFKGNIATEGRGRWNFGMSGNGFGMLNYDESETNALRGLHSLKNLLTGKIESYFGDVNFTDVFAPWNGAGLLKTIAGEFGSKIVQATPGVDYVVPSAAQWPKVLWSDNAKTVALASGGWGSILSADLAKRTIPANTWTPGMSLEFEIEGVKQANGSQTYLEFFIGPAGTYTTPYYIPVSTALDTGIQRFRTKVRLVCLTTGVAGTFAASFETLDGLGDEFAHVGRNATGYLDTINTTVDRVIDFAAQTPFDVVGVYSKCTMTIPGAGEGVQGGGGSGGPIVPFMGIFANAAALPASATPGHFATTQDGNLYVWEA